MKDEHGTRQVDKGSMWDRDVHGERRLEDAC